MGRHEQFSVGELTMVGIPVKMTTHTVTVLARNEAGAVLICTGADIPHDSDVGFATGCMFVKTDTGAIYFNVGTALLANFDLQGVVTSGAVATADIADGAVTTAKILAANVTLAKLAAGITPSHVVKYAGKITWSGSGASLATTVAGVVSTDIVIATIQTAPTQAAYLVSAAPTTDTITITLSAANTGNQAVIAYQVLRAAA